MILLGLVHFLHMLQILSFGSKLLITRNFESIILLIIKWLLTNNYFPLIIILIAHTNQIIGRVKLH